MDADLVFGWIDADVCVLGNDCQMFDSLSSPHGVTVQTLTHELQLSSLISRSPRSTRSSTRTFPQWHDPRCLAGGMPASTGTGSSILTSSDAAVTRSRGLAGEIRLGHAISKQPTIEWSSQESPRKKRRISEHSPKLKGVKPPYCSCVDQNLALQRSDMLLRYHNSAALSTELQPLVLDKTPLISRHRQGVLDGA
jgi:hypothetical protein